jgi:hypothetical protein
VPVRAGRWRHRADLGVEQIMRRWRATETRSASRECPDFGTRAPHPMGPTPLAFIRRKKSSLAGLMAFLAFLQCYIDLHASEAGNGGLSS